MDLTEQKWNPVFNTSFENTLGENSFKQNEPHQERHRLMYAITGITGQIGGVIGRLLVGAGQPVRAVVRDVDKGKAWIDRGCELALATIEDAASLTAAFRGAEGIFVLAPPNFDPQPGFPEARAIGAALRAALKTARPAQWFIFPPLGRRRVSPTC